MVLVNVVSDFIKGVNIGVQVKASYLYHVLFYAPLAWRQG